MLSIKRILRGLAVACIGIIPSLPAHAAMSNEITNLATSQISCASTATQAAQLRTGRDTLIIENTTTTAVYLGGSGVTTSNGMLLPGIVGASITIHYSGLLYCIVATGTATVTVMEGY